uniref:Protein E7 n=1 Tax=Phodopus sungorus papillomavirus 1 TaxID=1487796 RepID=A0A078BR99_9PAPI|nr:E7 protein [Phodopus sungorus papillomavirus 1]QWC92934.1 E7 [Phodopus sungorus papillomavirus 1]QWC92940.1 E7 [Phodopus sungorus papillomavirus 1]QWC92946.1 E7 [Phodopus sungorus papillomavirus 1]CDX10175.1 E7 protein [Phodopus sungorus papillomavirus 1]
MKGPENPKLLTVERAMQEISLKDIELILGPLDPMPSSIPTIPEPQPAVAFRYPQVATSRPTVAQPQPDCVDIGTSSLSPDQEGEEEPYLVLLDPYKIKTRCPSCRRTLRFVVAARRPSIRVLQDLLLGDLHFVCPTCVKQNVYDG